jgi:predicted ATPase
MYRHPGCAPLNAALRRRSIGVVFILGARVPDSSGLPQWLVSIPALRPLVDGAGLRFTAPVTFLVGENGSGKSTLLEAIAEQAGLDARGGRGAIGGGNRDLPKSPLGEAMALDYSYAGSRMRRAPRVRRHSFFFRAETSLEMNERFKQVRGYWDQDVEDRSHGEGFFDILDTMLTKPGLYLFDEPESPMSFTSCLRLLAKLGELAAAGSQIICATHSPVLAALPGAQLIELTPAGPVDTAWEELAAVTNLRAFLERPQNYLNRLLAPAPAPSAPEPQYDGAEQARAAAEIRARLARRLEDR